MLCYYTLRAQVSLKGICNTQKDCGRKGNGHTVKNVMNFNKMANFEGSESNGSQVVFNISVMLTLTL